MTPRYNNFKSNVEARVPDMVKDVDFDYLYSITRSRLKRGDSVFNYLNDEQKTIMINNILIFSFTQRIVNKYLTSKMTREEIVDEILGEFLRSEAFIMENFNENNPRF